MTKKTYLGGAFTRYAEGTPSLATTLGYARAKTSIRNADKGRKTQSSSAGFLSLEGAKTKAERPTITPMLKAFEPTMVPTGRPVSFIRTEYKEEVSSGREVPRATKVKAISLSLMPNLLAKDDEERIRSSEPRSKATMPATNKAKEYSRFIFSAGTLASSAYLLLSLTQ